MRAVLLRETGGPEVLRVEELERPEPSDGEVLIRVRAASINPIDWKIRSGARPKDLPAVLGNDVSGTIEFSRADGYVAGEDVFGLAPGGGYTEYATAPAALIARKPASVRHEQAAAIPVAGLTAWQALFDRGGLQRGQSALIAGAAGGVGHLAVQLATHAGARAIGTGSTRSRDFVLALGAERFVDYTKEDVSASVRGVDFALDTVGGETTQSLLATVREGGVLVTIANAPPEQEAAERSVRAELLMMAPSSEQLERIAELVGSGEIRVEIAQSFPLADAAQAHALSESGHTRGKLILVP